MNKIDTRYIVERHDGTVWCHIATCLTYASGLRCLKQMREKREHSDHRLVKVTTTLLSV